MPFLQLIISHAAQSHFSRAIGESSKIVPVLSEKVGLLCPVYHSPPRCLPSHVIFSEPHCGHFTTPSDHRNSTMNWRQCWKSANQIIASRRVSGVFIFQVCGGIHGMS